MLQRIHAVVFLFTITSVHAQYKNDDVLYKTVDWTNLCTRLQANKGYLLLDVRTPGEYNDTSDYINVGHLKDSRNISSGEITNRLAEISDYKEKPVFVYCSHSQRSRRVSKMLTDSGFTHVFNINGGITALYYTNAKDEPCLQQLITTKIKYKVISAADLCKKLSAPQNIFILDVRSDSAFKHITPHASDNAIGIIKNAVNIPLKDLEWSLPRIPKNKEIIVTDEYSEEAAMACALLKEKGFNNVSTPVEGLNRWLSEDNNDAACISKYYISPVKYKLINTLAFEKLALDQKNSLVIDVRTADEFNNKHQETWRNTGHIKDAKNIRANELVSRLDEINGYRNKTVLLYDYSGDEDVFQAATILTEHGFTNVNVLLGGLFNLRWTAANRNKPSLKDLVTDVPAYNL